MTDYIPDLTERYPEGFDGVDMYAPRDLEAKAWAEFTREYEEAKREALERYNRESYSIISQTDDGWTFMETNGGELLLCTVKDGQITDVYDNGKNIPENRVSMAGLWDEIRKEKDV